MAVLASIRGEEVDVAEADSLCENSDTLKRLLPLLDEPGPMVLVDVARLTLDLLRSPPPAPSSRATIDVRLEEWGRAIEVGRDRPCFRLSRLVAVEPEEM